MISVKVATPSSLGRWVLLDAACSVCYLDDCAGCLMLFLFVLSANILFLIDTNSVRTEMKMLMDAVKGELSQCPPFIFVERVDYAQAMCF